FRQDGNPRRIREQRELVPDASAVLSAHGRGAKGNDVPTQERAPRRANKRLRADEKEACAHRRRSGEARSRKADAQNARRRLRGPQKAGIQAWPADRRSLRIGASEAALNSTASLH